MPRLLSRSALPVEGTPSLLPSPSLQLNSIFRRATMASFPRSLASAAVLPVAASTAASSSGSPARRPTARTPSPFRSLFRLNLLFYSLYCPCQVAPAEHWPLEVLIVVVSDKKKDVSSTSGMQTSVETSTLIQAPHICLFHSSFISILTFHIDSCSNGCP